MISEDIPLIIETSEILEFVKSILVFELSNRHKFKKNLPESDEADGLSQELKLFHSVLCIFQNRTFPNDRIPQTCSQIIELLTTKDGVLESLRNLPESTRQNVDHSLVIPLLWPELLQDYPRSRDAAKIILQYLNTFSIMDTLLVLIDEKFNSNDWGQKFELVDQLQSILGQLEPSGMMRSPVVCFIVTYSVIIIIKCLDDSETALCQRSKYLLDSLSMRSVAAIGSCLEFQYRNVTADRVLVLKTIERLNKIRPDCKVANWSFYLQAFNIAAIDALVCNELGTTFCLNSTKIKANINSNNTHYMIAQEYRSRKSGKTASSTSLIEKFDPHFEFNQQEQDKKNTVQLIASICTYMTEDSSLDTGSKNWVLFARQVNLFFEFMPNMGSFSPNMNPADLRKLIIFPTFLFHLPNILDKAIPVAKYFMQLILNMLIFSASKERPDLAQTPNYSLALLSPDLQAVWLKSVLIFLYKYDANSQVDGQALNQIVHICLSILRKSNHSCLRERKMESENRATPQNENQQRFSESSKLLKNLRKYVNRDEKGYKLNIPSSGFSASNSASGINRRLYRHGSIGNINLSEMNEEEAIIRLLQNPNEQESSETGYCIFCHQITEETSDDILSLAMTCLTEFVKKNPKKASQLLPDIIQQISISALDSSINLSPVARQLLRCIYQQLRPHKIIRSVIPL